MSESHDLGIKGEELATDYLKKAGYRILRRNWCWGKNEVDIIAENNDFVVFAEVKTRAEDFLVTPASAINHAKQKAIISAADGYIKTHRVDKESRFDIITIVKKSKDFEIEHIESAFYPTLR